MYTFVAHLAGCAELLSKLPSVNTFYSVLEMSLLWNWRWAELLTPAVLISTRSASLSHFCEATNSTALDFSGLPS